MLINDRCTVCHTDVEAGDRVDCDVCGQQIHAECEAYETTFECARCAEDPEIDAVEF